MYRCTDRYKHVNVDNFRVFVMITQVIHIMENVKNPLLLEMMPCLPTILLVINFSLAACKMPER